MKIINTEFEKLFLIENYSVIDNRGLFVKTYSHDLFSESCLEFPIKEVYFSVSKKNVIRGMHFQRPPHDHTKFIYVTNGAILDVVLDIRKTSNTFGKVFHTVLSANIKSLYVPPGFAHGFLALEDNTVVVYNQSSCHAPAYDDGILWKSFGFDWGISNPIVSERDKQFVDFSDFQSCF